jgi:peptide/nickel transport system ATP-binding protein
LQERVYETENYGIKKPLLEIEDLKVSFQTYKGIVKALDDVDLKIYRGETVGIVGETGCGKSVTALSIVGLLPENARIEGGKILFKGENLLEKTKQEMREIRAKHIAMIFQDPMTFLNPVMTIGEQLEEVFALDKKRIAYEYVRIKTEGLKSKLEDASINDRSIILEQIRKLESLSEPPRLSRREEKETIHKMAIEVLSKVLLPEPERILLSYPHELSGGMRQRAMIAMAIARRPDILIADEITTSLDVTVQAQILELLRILRRELNSAIIIITHDLGVVANICDRVAIMYAGNIVEVAPVKEIFKRPLHPYTQGLLKAVPKITTNEVRLESIPGSIPDLINPPTGCRFHPRCPYSWELCREVKPTLLETLDGHLVHCHMYREGSLEPRSGK